MASWSKRRKILYVSFAAVILVGVIGVPAFFILYKAPTCFDGLQNGGEKGIDCGGKCEKVCAADFLPVDVSWARYEKVAPGIYNLAAYIKNPNVNGEARNVPFHMVLFDSFGVQIADKSGIVTIPPHRNTLAFLGNVSVGESVPAASPVFEFKTNVLDWNRKYDTLAPLVIAEKNYEEGDTGSSLQVKIENSSLKDVANVAVFAVLYDKDKNAIGFAKTKLDVVPAKSSVTAPFTWPLGRKGEVISQEVLVVAE